MEHAMTKTKTKGPPVPPQNRSSKGTGDPKSSAPQQKPPGRDDRPDNPDQQGQQANTKQNTTHQGYQHDR
jgi:hypothetical protein